MVKKYYYMNTLFGTVHLVGLGVFYFTRRNDLYLSSASKYQFLGALGFVFANLFVYSLYDTYFLDRSFQTKYRDVNDENLANIIKSLEDYKIKVHH